MTGFTEKVLEEEAESLATVRKILEGTGFDMISAKHGPEPVNGLLPIVLSHGPKHCAVDCNWFLVEDPIYVLGSAIRRILTLDEIEAVAAKMAAKP